MGNLETTVILVCVARLKHRTRESFYTYKTQLCSTKPCRTPLVRSESQERCCGRTTDSNTVRTYWQECVYMVKYGQVEFLWGLTGSLSCFASTSLRSVSPSTNFKTTASHDAGVVYHRIFVHVISAYISQ